MLLDRLTLHNFRNISELKLDCVSGFNIISGDNGAGKTSVLESVNCLALGRSFRSANNRSLIRIGNESCSVSGTVREYAEDTFSVMLSVGFERSGGVNVRIAGESGRFIDLIDHICVQSIHPQGTDLISKEAEGRRAFTDWGVYYSCPGFKELWRAFRRTLKQRNALLRSGRDGRVLAEKRDEFYVWNDLLALQSEQITKMRRAYIDDLYPVLREILHEFMPGIDIDFELAQGWEKGSDLRLQLASNLEKERSLGYTLYGCHRADLKIKSRNLSAGATLSRGQLKMLVYAMRLAQGMLLKQQTGRTCIYLIDDMNSELDDNSQSRLLAMLLQCRQQVFMSSIHSDFRNNLIPNGRSDVRIIRLENGVPV